MNHGIDSYFREHTRATRRVAALAALMSVVVLGALLALDLSPRIRDRLLSPEYFGFEGPEEFQRRLQDRSLAAANGGPAMLSHVVPVVSQKGGHHPGHALHPNAIPVPGTRFLGPGTDEFDLVMRGSVRHPELPQVRSEDLVFEHKVPASYPDILLERDVEGWVLLEVVVDTLGNVGEIAVRRSSGEPLFEQSASLAARQCRFRPYVRDGRVSAIVTRLRFSFTIDRVSD